MAVPNLHGTDTVDYSVLFWYRGDKYVYNCSDYKCTYLFTCLLIWLLT